MSKAGVLRFLDNSIDQMNQVAYVLVRIHNNRRLNEGIKMETGRE